MHHLTSPPAKHVCSNTSTSSPTLATICLLYCGHSPGCEMLFRNLSFAFFTARLHIGLRNFERYHAMDMYHAKTYVLSDQMLLLPNSIKGTTAPSDLVSPMVHSSATCNYRGGQGMAQTPPAVPHILSRSCYRNRPSHKLSLLDVNKQPHYFAESTLENQRPHHFILAQINEERLWGFFSLSTMKRGRVMVHLWTFAVFMFYVLESDFHLHYTSLMPSLH